MDLLNLLEDSSDEEDSRPQRRRQYRLRLNYYNFEGFAFKERFRLRQHEADIVLNRIAPRLINTKLNKALTPQQQLLTALHWLGTGSQYHSTSDMQGIGKSTVCRIVWRVVDAVIDLIFHEEIKWPENGEDITFDFLQLGGFPSVCGCIDGTLINIKAPYENEHQFVDRKGHHSLNCMMICGPDYTFYAVSARWPGPVHDSRVLRNSTVFAKFENGWRPFEGAVLLRDSGYGMQSWLMTPLHRNPNSLAEQNFNRAHKSTRRIIENAYGILKQRFPCLKFLRVAPERAGKIVMACAVLHNIATKEDFMVGIDEDDDDSSMIATPITTPQRLEQLLRYFGDS